LIHQEKLDPYIEDPNKVDPNIVDPIIVDPIIVDPNITIFIVNEPYIKKMDLSTKLE
jgi:hypothetical protein